MRPLSISAYTLTNALGRGVDDSLSALENQTSGLGKNSMPGVDFDTWIGKVDGLNNIELPAALSEFDCRNNRLAFLSLQQDNFEDHARNAVMRYGAARVGLFLGTSTSGVSETELAYQNLDPQTGQLPANFKYWFSQNIFSVGQFVRSYLGLKGPAEVISTACSSSAKTFATASRFIEAGLCDAAIVGGVDSLCEMTLYGFHSLQLVSEHPCRPFDQNRDGISIGEAAGFALLEKSTQQKNTSLLGYGESSDAHHISSPHPEGLGAARAINDALRRASINADRIDYINLHGTATRANDASEGNGVRRALGSAVACSSTKGFTGHTLGAAGITEALLCVLALQNSMIPGSLNTEHPDTDIGINYQCQSYSQPLNYVMSNSFGFGGSNCSLLLGAAP